MLSIEKLAAKWIAANPERCIRIDYWAAARGDKWSAVGMKRSSGVVIVSTRSGKNIQQAISRMLKDAQEQQS